MARLVLVWWGSAIPWILGTVSDVRAELSIAERLYPLRTSPRGYGGTRDRALGGRVVQRG